MPRLTKPEAAGILTSPAPWRKPQVIFMMVLVQIKSIRISRCSRPRRSDSPVMWNRPSKGSSKSRTRALMAALVRTPIAMAERQPFFARSVFPAPMFCPVKLESATLRLCEGMWASCSIRIMAE